MLTRRRNVEELGYHTAKNLGDTVEMLLRKGVMGRQVGEKRHKVV